jgi:hypothetical protein
VRSEKLPAGGRGAAGNDPATSRSACEERSGESALTRGISRKPALGGDMLVD